MDLKQVAVLLFEQLHIDPSVGCASHGGCMEVDRRGAISEHVIDGSIGVLDEVEGLMADDGPLDRVQFLLFTGGWTFAATPDGCEAERLAGGQEQAVLLLEGLVHWQISLMT